MNSSDLGEGAKRAQALQTAFFALPNRCTPWSLSNDENSQSAYEASLRLHARGETDRPVLLPFRAQDDGPTAWYACAASMQMIRALQEEIHAFLGPSFVVEREPGRVLDEADQYALPLIADASLLAIRFDTRDARTDEVVLRQWRVYGELLQRRPRLASYVPTTFHQVRASFDRALLAGNEPEALAAMATLRERFGISAENRRFLEIRLDAAFARWDAIVEHPLLPQLVNLQLPPETYGDVIEALYTVHVQPFEAAAAIDALLEQFKKSVLDSAKTLFSTRRASRRPAVSVQNHAIRQPMPHFQ